MYKDIDDKFIMEACKDSGLADFISEVSLDYVVGQNGACLLYTSWKPGDAFDTSILDQMDDTLGGLDFKV